MYGHMKKGHRMSFRASARHFSRVAQYVHSFNVHQEPMRGGFRL